MEILPCIFVLAVFSCCFEEVDVLNLIYRIRTFAVIFVCVSNGHVTGIEIYLTIRICLSTHIHHVPIGDYVFHSTFCGYDVFSYSRSLEGNFTILICLAEGLAICCLDSNAYYRCHVRIHVGIHSLISGKGQGYVCSIGCLDAVLIKSSVPVCIVGVISVYRSKQLISISDLVSSNAGAKSLAVDEEQSVGSRFAPKCSYG